MKQIPEYKNFFATENGEIFKKTNGVLVPLKHHYNGYGYPRVYLGNGKNKNVSHLVLETFIGPRPKGMWCCHFDDDPKNNNLSNLRWDLPSGNYQDAIRNGRSCRGQKNGNHKLSKEQVLEIRRAKGQLRQIAKKYDINFTHVRRIKNKLLWSWL